MCSTYSAKTDIHNAVLYGLDPLHLSQCLRHSPDKDGDRGGDGKTCLLSTNEAALAPVKYSPSPLACLPFLPSLQTTPGPASPMRV